LPTGPCPGMTVSKSYFNAFSIVLSHSMMLAVSAVIDEWCAAVHEQVAVCNTRWEGK
jgi:hypothetical protein